MRQGFSSSLFLLAAVLVLSWTHGAAAAPSVAFFYGVDPPLDELKAFDIVVVEPDHGADPAAFAKPGYSALYAYVSVGEVQPSRPYFASIPAGWLQAENRAWGSRVVDLSQPDYPAFFAETVVAPLWARGFRGFFLDTLDSYRRIKGFSEKAQQQGLIQAIEILQQRFPGIQLILNRGFEILPAVRGKVQMVAAESLFQGWDAGEQRYTEVPAADRDWLLGQLRHAQNDLGIPALAIDYAPPEDRALTRSTADRIKQLGFVPYVADGALNTLGIGTVEVMPRRILAVYSKQESPLLDLQDIVRFIAMPLNHLGYRIEYREIGELVPGEILNDRYAGIVVSLGGYVTDTARYADWFGRQTQAGMRIAVFRSFGFGVTGKISDQLGLDEVPAPRSKLTITKAASLIGFETSAVPNRSAFQPLRLRDGSGMVLLRLNDTQGQSFDPVAITPWGGYALHPFAFVSVPGTEQSRWIVDPFQFLQQALALPDMPVPDFTTENGRRLMFAHIDGDGFASRAEFPGSPLAAEVLLHEAIERYRTVPHTVSVIEGEVSPQGLYPELAPQLESAARKIFALPNVEAATHTYSHPFKWSATETTPDDETGTANYHLNIPGYKVDLQREILGSADYIRKHLMPPGKPVNLLLWSGDAAPSETTLRIVRQAGMLNMNGGTTTITHAEPSLTAVSGVGIAKGGEFQTFAPVMNENLYTNLWLRSFYGFRSVIQTFEMTGSPRRLSAVDIYYHTYSASKPGSLKVLKQVYDWALAQPLHPVFASEYIRKTLDFNSFVIARNGNEWIARGNGDLRTLRLPGRLGYPQQATGVAGYTAASLGERYLHLTGTEARFSLGAAPEREPLLATANARLTDWRRDKKNLYFTLTGYAPLEFSLAQAGQCQVFNGTHLLNGQNREGTLSFRLPNAAATLIARCAKY